VLKGNFDPDSFKQRGLRVAFVRVYYAALKLQADDAAIICFYDETYVNTGHTTSHTWYLETTKLSARGKRRIVLHVMTKDGPVVTRD
jgi:hypothetical protein